MPQATLLKQLLQERHWQTWGTFTAEYEKAAVSIDTRLRNTCPSRATFNRWMSGDVKNSPHPDACRVLESMFPGRRVAELLKPADSIPPLESAAGGHELLGMRGPSDVTERELRVRIDIAKDGAAEVVYEHHVENTSPTSFSRFVRELWFAVTDGPLQVEPLPDDGHPFVLSRVTETPAHLTYACQLLPALAPGEQATVRYRGLGGRFGAEHYWRQAIVCPVDLYAITVRLEGVTQLSMCTAVEERPDGSEVSAGEDLTLTRDGDHLVLDLARRNLRPNQFVTLKWDFPRAIA